MKRKLSLAQGMVEYALLLTMVTVPMIVIYATLGDAAGEVWQTMVDGLSDTHMFEIKEYSLPSTVTDESTEETPTEDPGTPTLTYTLDPSLPTEVPTNTMDPSIPTDVPTATDIPTQTEIPPTETAFIPATYTFTPSPVPPTETPTDLPTEVPSITPTMHFITSVTSYWGKRNKVTIEIHQDLNPIEGKPVLLTVKNISTGATQEISCGYYCSLEFPASDGTSGYVNITSTYGDDVNYQYPARGW